MKASKGKALVTEVLCILLGSVLYAMSTVLFVFPNGILFGGTSGISVILESFLPFSPGTILVVINFLLVLLAFIILGKGMAFKTLIGSVLTTVFVGVFETLFALQGPVVASPYLSAVIGAAIIAVASGIMFYVDSSSGGTDIIALIVRKYSDMDIGKALLLTDVLIVLIGGALSGVAILLSSVIGLLIKTLGIDFVISAIKKHREKGGVPMTKFLILRHGYSKGNKERKFTGQQDVPLDEIGVAQAESAAKYILENFKIDSIYSSPLSRAYNTAKPVADALSLPINTVEDIKEIDVGVWEGMRVVDIAEQYPEEFELYSTNVGLARPVGGESYLELAERVSKAFAQIAQENPGKTVLVATHGGVIRALRYAWLGYTPEQLQSIPHVTNASLTVAEYADGKGEFKMIDFNEYLDDKVTEMPLK